MTDVLSRLLGLPAGVRDHIWQHVLGGMTLHTGEWLTDEGARWGVNQRQRFIEDRNGNTLNDQAIQAGRTSQRHLNRLDEMPKMEQEFKNGEGEIQLEMDKILTENEQEFKEQQDQIQAEMDKTFQIPADVVAAIEAAGRPVAAQIFFAEEKVNQTD
ncbi:hypothetical protein LTR56_022532 [Elasticomyces elasticus]|nr:hypothetical protein LTR56_022532 [Elasticomyces elasticus]